MNGSPSSSPFTITRTRPLFSVKKMRPSGASAKPVGRSRPEVTTSWMKPWGRLKKPWAAAGRAESAGSSQSRQQQDDDCPAEEERVTNVHGFHTFSCDGPAANASGDGPILGQVEVWRMPSAAIFSYCSAVGCHWRRSDPVRLAAPWGKCFPSADPACRPHQIGGRRVGAPAGRRTIRRRQRSRFAGPCVPG